MTPTPDTVGAGLQVRRRVTETQGLHHWAAAGHHTPPDPPTLASALNDMERQVNRDDFCLGVPKTACGAIVPTPDGTE